MTLTSHLSYPPPFICPHPTATEHCHSYQDSLDQPAEVASKIYCDECGAEVDRDQVAGKITKIWGEKHATRNDT